MILRLLLWSSILLLVYSYILYPLLLSFLSRGKKYSHSKYLLEDSPQSLPLVTVLFAAYNEEDVIEEKLQSIFKTTYPLEKLEVIVGSDGSTDATDSLVNGFSKNHNCKLVRLSGRNGKSNVINQIQPMANGEILILTDANIIFQPQLIPNLIRNFADAEIGLVGANILNTGTRKDGISVQETQYISRENKIKEQEGRLWGTMAGAFGACYAVRKNLFPEIPRNFLMEDFYVTMSVLKSGFKSICDLEAKCTEDVSNLLHEEYKRKVRISAGNFQNLRAFKSLLWPPFSPIGFSILSHKVIRWFGPFLLILAFLSNAVIVFQLIDGLCSGSGLGSNSGLGYWFGIFGGDCLNQGTLWSGMGFVGRSYVILLILQFFGFISPLLDFILSRFGAHIPPLRYINYFYAMNLALLAGFIKFIRGIRTNAWEPTLRNQ